MSSAPVGSVGLRASSESALPAKLFFRIGEVASLVGVEPHVLRYWEREFRSIRPTKSAKGQRVYSRKDVENLLRVRDLLYRDGFTIAGAKKRLQRGGVALNELEPRDAGVELGAEVGAEEGEHDVETEHERDAHAAEPESGPRSHAVIHAAVDSGPRSEGGVRTKLTALRAEVEGFLDELESEQSQRSDYSGRSERG